MSPTYGGADCPACRLIDRANGLEDGRLYPSLAPRVKNEASVHRRLKRAADRAADRITAFSGSLAFVYIHAGWFALWIAVNLGLLGAALIFDRFPFGLLTMIVSLEAIFLSTFVLISQNRQSARADLRSEIDFENNVRGELWTVHVGEKLGVDADHIERMAEEAIAGYRAQERESDR